jgi:hypothetical protein
MKGTTKKRRPRGLVKSPKKQTPAETAFELRDILKSIRAIRIACVTCRAALKFGHASNEKITILLLNANVELEQQIRRLELFIDGIGPELGVLRDIAAEERES